jgi:hypothetical protein
MWLTRKLQGREIKTVGGSFMAACKNAGAALDCARALQPSETRAGLDALQRHPELNHRQQALIAHALRHPGFVYRIAGHEARHAVVYQTARTDLLSLGALGLLEQRKAGRALVFVAPKDLDVRLRSRGSAK